MVISRRLSALLTRAICAISHMEGPPQCLFVPLPSSRIEQARIRQSSVGRRACVCRLCLDRNITTSPPKPPTSADQGEKESQTPGRTGGPHLHQQQHQPIRSLARPSTGISSRCLAPPRSPTLAHATEALVLCSSVYAVLG
ncbi:hypothetical protein B0T19DRAFT_422351, partial [Cercophora scortea]